MSSWEHTFDLLKGISNYTYGVGEKSGEEWKAHEAAQAKKIKSAPALTSEALHKKYNSPEWKKKYKALREKYPSTEKGMSSWEQTFDLLKGHGCKGCVKCKGKAHHDEEGGRHMKKGLTSWFDSPDALYKSGWEEANDLLKGPVPHVTKSSKKRDDGEQGVTYTFAPGYEPKTLGGLHNVDLRKLWKNPHTRHTVIRTTPAQKEFKETKKRLGVNPKISRFLKLKPNPSAVVKKKELKVKGRTSDGGEE